MRYFKRRGECVFQLEVRVGCLRSRAACAIRSRICNFFRRVLGRDKAVSAAADVYLFYLLDWKVSAKFHAAF